MIYEFQNEGKPAAGSRRVLAVVGDHADRAKAVAARFAAEGEQIDARWYADSRELLTHASELKFEAVILFPTQDETTTDADEAFLRSSLNDTPLYRVA